MSLEILKAQLATSQAYVAYYDARIRSGAYKTRIVHKGGGGEMIDGKWEFTGPILSEQELLEDELGTMLNHIHRMNDIIDAMHDHVK